MVTMVPALLAILSQLPYRQAPFGTGTPVARWCLQLRSLARGNGRLQRKPKSPVNQTQARLELDTADGAQRQALGCKLGVTHTALLWAAALHNRAAVWQLLPTVVIHAIHPATSAVSIL